MYLIINIDIYYNINIKTIILQNKGYSLDSGPFFLSVEHLVEYYCLHRDGLECKLRLAIKSGTWYIFAKKSLKLLILYSPIQLYQLYSSSLSKISVMWKQIQ